jgi:hypothetical protein
LQVGHTASGLVPTDTLAAGKVSVRSSSQLGQKYGAWKETTCPFSPQKFRTMFSCATTTGLQRKR